MSTNSVVVQSSRFKIGWLLLLVTAAAMTLMHSSLIFVEDDPILFFGYAAFSLYALLIVYIPFRRGEKWAWFAAWLLPLGLTLPALLSPELAFYYAIAGLCAAGLLLTMGEFLSRERP